MFLTVTYLDDNVTPYVWSVPLDGANGEAKVLIEPFGPDKSAMFADGAELDPNDFPPPEKGSTTLTMSLAEAEELARQLVIVVQGARGGTYSNMGEALKRYTKEKRLNEAWETLMSQGTDDQG